MNENQKLLEIRNQNPKSFLHSDQFDQYRHAIDEFYFHSKMPSIRIEMIKYALLASEEANRKGIDFDSKAVGDAKKILDTIEVNDLPQVVAPSNIELIKKLRFYRDFLAMLDNLSEAQLGADLKKDTIRDLLKIYQDYWFNGGKKARV